VTPARDQTERDQAGRDRKRRDQADRDPTGRDRTGRDERSPAEIAAEIAVLHAHIEAGVAELRAVRAGWSGARAPAASWTCCGAWRGCCGPAVARGEAVAPAPRGVYNGQRRETTMNPHVAPAVIGNVGPMELLVILLILLLLFGASRLAGLGAAAGKTIKEFRRALSEDDEKESQPTKPGA